jgi:hypothetical protein
MPTGPAIIDRHGTKGVAVGCIFSTRACGRVHAVLPCQTVGLRVPLGKGRLRPRVRPINSSNAESDFRHLISVLEFAYVSYHGLSTG